MSTKYQVVNGTAYHAETKAEVIRELEWIRQSRTRVRLYYGDVDTGRCWNEEHDVCGYISRTSGAVKIPILLHNSHSFSGGSILDHCIVKIAYSAGKQTIWQADNFQQPDVVVRLSNNLLHPFTVYIDDKLYANCKTKASAFRLQAHMR